MARFPQEDPNPVPRADRDGLLLYANPAASMYNGGALAHLAKTGPTEELINVIRACWAARGRISNKYAEHSGAAEN